MAAPVRTEAFHATLRHTSRSLLPMLLIPEDKSKYNTPMETNEQTTRKNRLYGLLFVILVSVAAYFRPPSRLVAQRRGTLGLLEDMGMSSAADIRLYIYWGVLVVLWGVGGYQMVTGQRVNFWHR